MAGRRNEIRNVLVTGGAGFIGTHLVRRLLAEGCVVTILDNFNPQVHRMPSISSDIGGKVQVVQSDICDRAQLVKAVSGQDAVVHLAAETGTGQSMYSVAQYERVNCLGTAELLEVTASEVGTSVKKFVVASSRAIYGEGKYKCESHGVVYPDGRTHSQLEIGKFEPLCPLCGRECVRLPTDESSRVNPLSVYALTKYSQERMVLLRARSMRMAAIALRYQNVFGPGQSLSNPYTGILAIFSTLARCGSPINIFEDGKESRDFVYVDDVIEATWRAIQNEPVSCEVVNVGSGIAVSVYEVAATIVSMLGSSSEIVVSGEFREGDIRHNVADLLNCEKALGFSPRVSFVDGLHRFIQWAMTQEPVESRYDESLKELRARGLLRG